jgi:hypothetical protein
MSTERAPHPRIGIFASTPPTLSKISATTSDSQLQQLAVSLDRRREGLVQQWQSLRVEQSELDACQEQLTAEQQRRRTAVASADYDAVRDLVHNASISLGYDSPHAYQIDSACSLHSGHDTAVIYPAGAGKSLTVFLAGALSPKQIIIVMVPLLALASQLCTAVMHAFSVDPIEVVSEDPYTPTMYGGIELADGTRRPLAVVIGGNSSSDFDERIQRGHGRCGGLPCPGGVGRFGIGGLRGGCGRKLL